MKNRIIVIALFVVFLLGACVEVQPSQFPPTLIPSPSSLPMLHVITSAFNSPVHMSPFPSSTPSPTVTASPTLDYAALGLPSPTATPTFDYDGLVSYYLTPFTPMPTMTGISSLTPMAEIESMVPSVTIRKVIPQPPPLWVVDDNGGGFQKGYPKQLPAYIQSVTDLMNYANGDEKIYFQYIESWVPQTQDFSILAWFLEDDFDSDGNPEWLVSIPVDSEGDWGSFRLTFLFEKTADGYYPVHMLDRNVERGWEDFGKIILIDDINNNHLKDVIFRIDLCGTACTTYLRVSEWDGHEWKDSWVSAPFSQITFADLDDNGTAEIMFDYVTGAANKYNHPYPFRHLVDVYGWKNNRYELLDQIYPPTDSVFAVIWDIDSALSYKNAELALKGSRSIMENLDSSCDQMKTYVGIQTMLAYALQGDSNSMQSTLAKLEKYCDHSTNAYVNVAKILWLAFEKTHDPVSACLAMDRFRANEYFRKEERASYAYFLNDRIINIPSCPLK